MAGTSPSKTESVPTQGESTLNVSRLKSYFPLSIRHWTCFFLLSTIFIYIWVYALTVSSQRASYRSYGYSQILAAISNFGHMLSPQQCPDVEQLAIGHWERWNTSRITKEEIEDIKRYNIHQWKRFKLPLTLQREDKKCGNVPYGPGWWISR